MASVEFIQLLTSHQSRLYAYILSLVFDPDQADDLLQQTNTILWENGSDFELGTNFAAWSFRIAHFQVLAHRKSLQRDKLIFDDDLVQSIAQISEALDVDFQEKQQLLRRCLQKLNFTSRELIRRRYSPGESITSIANELGRSIGAVRQQLFRVRATLISCVNSSMLRELEV